MKDARNVLEPLLLNAYDESRVRHLTQRLLSGAKPREFSLLGEGMHFVAYGINAGGFEMVIKVAKPEFFQGRRQGKSNWYRAISKLQAVSAPLIPPMRIFDVDEHSVVVMPRGYDINPKINRLDVDAALDLTKRALEANRLYVDDYWQILQSNDVAFNCDWSDLYINEQTSDLPKYEDKEA